MVVVILRNAPHCCTQSQAFCYRQVAIVALCWMSGTCRCP